MMMVPEGAIFLGKSHSKSNARVKNSLVPRCPVFRATIPGWDGKGGGVIGLKARAILTL